MMCGTLSSWSFIMATLLAVSRFLRFLEPEEENALLAAASPRSFERNEVVLDQDVPLRTIYLIEEGSPNAGGNRDGYLLGIAPWHCRPGQESCVARRQTEPEAAYSIASPT